MRLPSSHGLASLTTCCGAIVAGAFLLFAPPDGSSAETSTDPSRPAETPSVASLVESDAGRVGERLTCLPAPFVPNLGQWDHRAPYVARFGPMDVFLEQDGWTFTLAEPPREEEGEGVRGVDDGDRRGTGPDGPTTRGVAVRMTFEGVGSTELVPELKLDAVHHYFLGDDPAAWRSNVPLYGAVLYRGVHHGVDVRAREQDGHFEFDVLLAPGADLGQVEVAVEGIDGMHLARDGSLVLATAVGPVRMPPPPSWEAGPSGEQTPIVCEYELRGAARFGFTVPGRRPGWALVVDPGLIWSTRLGGSALDVVTGVELDAQNRAICAGRTRSPNFPASTGALQGTLNGNEDGFLARLSADGSALLWATFFGGSNIDGIEDLHLAVRDHRQRRHLFHGPADDARRLR